MKTFSFISALLVVFLVWIVIATNSTTRIERACQPFLWTGKFMESVFLLTYERGAETVVRKANQFDYGCRYTLWRLFFEEEYLEKKKRDEALRAKGWDESFEDGGDIDGSAVLSN